MGFYGDAHDSPPVIIRVINTVVCVFGVAILLWFLVPTGMISHVVIVISALVLGTYLIWTVPKGGQTVLVSMFIWTMLIAYALFVPMGS